ncbi:8115_t:CDS:2, partial [Entrophospora sp. SA101]
IVFDNRGNGESSVPSSKDPISIDLMARDTIALVKHLGIKQFNLLGWSMGVSISRFFSLPLKTSSSNRVIEAKNEIKSLNESVQILIKIFNKYKNIDLEISKGFLEQFYFISNEIKLHTTNRIGNEEYYDFDVEKLVETQEFEAVIKLGFPGYVNGFDIDTSHFIGNHAPFADVECCCMIDKDPIHNDHAKWDKMLDKVELGPNAQHFFGISGNPQKYYTHIKINIYPDGGVARFRVYGTVFASFPKNPTELFDLAFVGNGGTISSYSDQHFGKVSDLLLPGRGNKNMSDGWETRRSREPNHKDWCIVKLGCPGYLEKVEVDTAYFKGNYPDSVELEGCFSGNPEISDLKSKWTIILPKTKLFPHKQHYFDLLKLDGKISH